MTIKYDNRNYRKHNEKNKSLIKKSLKDCGAGRSIVIDNEDNIIAGNGIYEQAQALNMPVKVVETDGSELVVVKRTDLATDDEKRKQLAVMDNSTSDSSEFNMDMLVVDFDVDKLSEFGVDFTGIDSVIDMPELSGEEKLSFERMSFILADEQAEEINRAIDKVKKSDIYANIDTFGNTNGNGNALYAIITEWLNG